MMKINKAFAEKQKAEKEKEEEEIWKSSTIFCFKRGRIN
jgi:hypothetical protein